MRAETESLEESWNWKLRCELKLEVQKRAEAGGLDETKIDVTTKIVCFDIIPDMKELISSDKQEYLM